MEFFKRIEFPKYAIFIQYFKYINISLPIFRNTHSFPIVVSYFNGINHIPATYFDNDSRNKIVVKTNKQNKTTKKRSGRKTENML